MTSYIKNYINECVEDMIFDLKHLPEEFRPLTEKISALTPGTKMINSIQNLLTAPSLTNERQLIKKVNQEINKLETIIKTIDPKEKSLEFSPSLSKFRQLHYKYQNPCFLTDFIIFLRNGGDRQTLEVIHKQIKLSIDICNRLQGKLSDAEEYKNLYNQEVKNNKKLDNIITQLSCCTRDSLKNQAFQKKIIRQQKIQILEIENKNAELVNQVETLTEESHSYKTDINTLKTENSSLSNEVMKKEATIKELTNKVSDLSSENRILKIGVKTLQSQVGSLQNDMNQLKSQMQKIQTLLEKTLCINKELMEEVQEKNDTNKALEKVLQNKQATINDLESNQLLVFEDYHNSNSWNMVEDKEISFPEIEQKEN